MNDAFRALHPKWEAQFTSLFLSGAVAIFIEDHVSSKEANAYVLIERKMHDMGMLPSVVSVLRRYLSEQRAGHYTGLAEFLPVFPKQLRVAKRIVNL